MKLWRKFKNFYKGSRGGCKFRVVSKDGSKSMSENLTLENSEILAASYKKKYFWESDLKIMNIVSNENYENVSDKILLSKPNKIFINNIEFEKFVKNKILKKIYIGS